MQESGESKKMEGEAGRESKPLNNTLNSLASQILIELHYSSLHSNSITISQLTQRIHRQYVGIYLVLKGLEREGLITTEKVRRNRYIKLTEKGGHIAELFSQIKMIYEGGSANGDEKSVKCVK